MAESSPVECSSRSCKGGCSLESCTQICGASDVCDHFTMCSEYQCHDLACWDDCSSVTDYCQSATGTVGDLQRTSSHSESLDPIQCPWILPGEPCDVTVETKQALGKHINQEHIDPQSTLKCPWGQCTKVLDRRSISNHFLQQHQPEQLENWSDFVVTGLEELDCRFGGCEVTLRDPSQLKNHVNEDHLNLMGFHDWSSNNEILQNSNNPSDLCQRLPQGKTTQTYNDLQYMSTPHGSRSWNSLPEISPPKCSQSNGPLQNQMGSTPFGRSTANYQTQQYGLSSLWQKQADAYSIFSRSHDHPAITQGRSYQCVFGDTTMSNDQAHDSDRLSCLWIVDLKGLSTCDKCFPTAKQLQEHVENEHIHLKKSYPQSQAKASAKCHWKGCLRSEEKGPLSDMNKLSRHVLTHTNHRPYACSHCQSTFATKGQCNVHERTHTGEKPHECDKCGKKFANDSSLKIHTRTHTGEKPHKCDQCDFACADSTNLIKHKKTHAPNEHYCSICFKGFGRRSTLRRHMGTHSSEKARGRKRRKLGEG